MAKQMVCAVPGALGRLMALRKVTQSELASQTGLDVKTLRAVNLGKPIKDETLKRTAEGVRFPVEHLLNDDAANAGIQQNQDYDSGKLESRDYVLLKRADAEILKEFLAESDEILWSLDVPKLDPEAKKELLQFEELVKAWHLRNEPPLLGSLSAQIEQLETATEIPNHLKKLADTNIGVLSGQYSRWAHNTEFYEGGRHDSYDSTVVTIIALRPTSISTVKVSVDRGEVPPKTFQDFLTPVSINGHRVWNGSRAISFVRELDDDVPF
jgi:transcriptional regulator with XRE-family HTH domain